MKVLHILRGRERGGIESLWIDLSRELDRQGLDVAGVVVEDGTLARKIRRAGLTAEVFSDGRSSRLAIVRRIKRFVRANNFTLIHTHGVGSNLYGRLAKLLGCRLPLITSIHADMASELCGALSFWQARLYHGIDRSMRGLTDQFIAVCHASAGKYIAEGIPRARMRVIHNGIAVRPDPVGGDGELKTRLGIPAGARVVGTVGRLTPVKNQELLVRSMPHLLRRVPDLFLLIVGNGPLKENLERLSSEQGVSHRVIFAGWRGDVHELLQIMDVFALPSLSEALPMSLLEAMMCQKPIVATRVGGIPEVIDDGVSGILVPPDEERMVSALSDLFLDGKAAAGMAQQGRRILETRFSIERMAAELIAFYRTVHEAP